MAGLLPFGSAPFTKKLFAKIFGYGTAGQVFMANGGTTVPSWGSVGLGSTGLQMLANTEVHNASSDVAEFALTAGTTSFTNLTGSDGNMSVTFTAASSQVMVICEGCGFGNTTNMIWGLLSGGSLISGQSQIINNSTGTSPGLQNNLCTFVVPTVAGTTYTWTWAWRFQNPGSSNANLFGGPNFGKVKMRVFAINAPPVAKTVVVPTTGFAATIASSATASVIKYVNNPASTLASGANTMPATPVDGQIVQVSTTQQITSYTLNPNAGQNISNAPSAALFNAGPAGMLEYVWDAATSTWYP